LEKFKNTYRIKSSRKPYWNYAANAIYFLTIIVHHRAKILSAINKEKQVELTEYGVIVEEQLLRSFELRDELFLHEYIIMPDHIHVLVEINKPGVPLIGQENVELHQPFRLPKSISSFIAGFKSAVSQSINNYLDKNELPTQKYNRNNHFFMPGYHDRVVRNHREYVNIRNYIIQNPYNP